MLLIKCIRIYIIIINKLYNKYGYMIPVLIKIKKWYSIINFIIKVITGIRRCGKSSLMQMIADEISESGVNKPNTYCYYCGGPKNYFKNNKNM